MRKPFSLLAILLTLPQLLVAAPPPWWASRGATNTNPENATAAANIGQMKHFASKAYDELQVNLPGGAGSGVEALIASWKTPPAQLVPPATRDDSVAATVSQLKAVGKKFYDRLIGIGYRDPLGNPLVAFVAHTGDSDLSNLGQLKHVFRFDVSYSSDGDSLPDWWELKYFGNLAQTENGDFDGDSVLNGVEFSQGRSPNAGYSADGSGTVALQVFAPN